MNRIKAISLRLAFTMIFSILITLFSAFALADPPLRNVAYRKASWHSSAANYDNTAQLIADGILGVLSNEVIDSKGTSASNPTYGQMIPGTVNSEWISASSGEEWVYWTSATLRRCEASRCIGARTTPSAYDIQVSDDAKTLEHGCKRSRRGRLGSGNQLATRPEPVSARFSAKLPPARTTSSAKWKLWARTP